jgi:hypothetical protein
MDEVLRQGGRRLTQCKKCAQMYVNAKIKPAETTPGIRGGCDKGE